MSEGSVSDLLSKSVWFPLILLIMGLVLLWMGNRELIQFQESLPDYITLRPDSATLWLLILGAASTAAGIAGLLRSENF